MYFGFQFKMVAKALGKIRMPSNPSLSCFSDVAFAPNFFFNRICKRLGQGYFEFP